MFDEMSKWSKPVQISEIILLNMSYANLPKS